MHNLLMLADSFAQLELVFSIFLLYKNKGNRNAVWGAADDCLLKGDFKLYKMYLNLKNEHAM